MLTNLDDSSEKVEMRLHLFIAVFCQCVSFQVLKNEKPSGPEFKFLGFGFLIPAMAASLTGSAPRPLANIWKGSCA